MTGQLEGGWEYVIAAYLITWIFFGGYAASLWLRSIALKAPKAGSNDLFDQTGGTQP
jgi:hypothetical protein